MNQNTFIPFLFIPRRIFTWRTWRWFCQEWNRLLWKWKQVSGTWKGIYKSCAMFEWLADWVFMNFPCMILNVYTDARLHGVAWVMIAKTNLCKIDSTSYADSFCPIACFRRGCQWIFPLSMSQRKAVRSPIYSNALVGLVFPLLRNLT